MLCLHCCTRAFSSGSEQGPLFEAVHSLLIVVASLVALGMPASVVAAHRLSSCVPRALEHRLSSCGARTQLLHGMWDLPRSGIEPVFPALAGGFLTTAPPGKSWKILLNSGLTTSRDSHSSWWGLQNEVMEVYPWADFLCVHYRETIQTILAIIHFLTVQVPC